jgi:hypothetical protein
MTLLYKNFANKTRPDNKKFSGNLLEYSINKFDGGFTAPGNARLKICRQKESRVSAVAKTKTLEY